jgi:hypothetical protein
MKNNIYSTPTDGTGGVYYGVNLFGALGSSNITVSDLTFEMNGQNNLQPAGLPHIMNTFRFYRGKDITIQNITVRNSSGHNMVVFQEPIGDGAVVKNSNFSIGGRGVPGNTLNSDFSFLYSEWSRTEFINNTIFQAPSNDHASGGIELHGSRSVAEENRIENCNPAFWIASTPGAVDDVLVTKNTIINANRGIAFWVGTNTLSNVRVTSNSISVRYNPVFTEQYGLGDDAAGIIVPWLAAAYAGQYTSATASGSAIRNLAIQNNVIFSSDGQLPLNTQPGISIQGVHNALITGNIIRNIGSSGIVLRGSPWGANRIVIARNSLNDFGLNKTSRGREGIVVYTNGSSSTPPLSNFDSRNIVIFANEIRQSVLETNAIGCSYEWPEGHMRNLTAGSNSLTNIAQPMAGPQAGGSAMTTRNPVEIVRSRPATKGTCVTGDITWRVAKDVMDGWLCADGVWQVFGR